MSPNRLAVWLGDQRCGELSPGAEPWDYTFAYGPETVTREGPALSLSLPVRKEPYRSAACRPFFEGLLPEGTVRDQVARQVGVSPGNSFGLLAALGRDCAGAVVLLPDDEPPPTPTGSAQWLSEPELRVLVENLRRQPVATDRRRRASLAGAQSKTVLVRSATGRFGLPAADAPSTHLLKPQWEESDWPDIAFNERFCMRVAECAGLRVARTELLEVGNRTALLVERYDRTLDGAALARVHQEDICQALAVPASAKYQHEGGPSVRETVALMRHASIRAAADVLALVDAVIFNWAIGNSDAHGKNFGVLHEHDGPRLAPLYDLVSTLVYDDLDHAMAMAIGETFDPNAVNEGDWLDCADDCGLSYTQLVRRRDPLLRRIATCAAQVAALARTEGWHRPTIDRIVALADRRATRARRESSP